MSLKNPNQGNKTILTVSLISVFVYVFLALRSFGVVPSSYEVFTTFGAAVWTLLAAVILGLETFFEGKMPNLASDRMAQVNTIFIVATAVFAVILFVGSPVINATFQGVLGVVYFLTAFLLGRELLWD